VLRAGLEATMWKGKEGGAGHGDVHFKGAWQWGEKKGGAVLGATRR
jgi:hypothetical protein